MGQAVESLSGGQRQAVAVARAAAFSSKVIILDEPTAALGVKESGQVLKLIQSIRERGLPVILISHNMPQVFEVADRIHIQRLGKRAAVVSPKTISMSDAVAVMTGALKVAPEQEVEVGRGRLDAARPPGGGQAGRGRVGAATAVDRPVLLGSTSLAQRARSDSATTRSAWAAIVRAGFIAADDGKKPPSTTQRFSHVVRAGTTGPARWWPGRCRRRRCRTCGCSC